MEFDVSVRLTQEKYVYCYWLHPPVNARRLTAFVLNYCFTDLEEAEIGPNTKLILLSSC